MQSQNQPEIIRTPEGQAEKRELASAQLKTDSGEESSQVETGRPVVLTQETDKEEKPEVRTGGFDWLAVGVACFISAFFALTARFNSQPAPSFVPAAVLSATGCGLLVTALRKLRARPGVGLLEAGLAGFFMALVQFGVAFTYPDIFTFVTQVPASGHAFLLTWGLIGLFSVTLSIAGAALGHLAFAPLRPLPSRTRPQSDTADLDEQGEESIEPLDDQDGAEAEETRENAVIAETVSETDTTQEDEEEAEAEEVPAAPVRSLSNYAITVLLLALLPMMIGYVFAGAYDFVMNAIHIDQTSPAFYPTLSLLAGLLPWRLPVPISLGNANGSVIVFTLLWRIPDSVLGNPDIFDVQALEAFIFNAAALALFLIVTYRKTEGEHRAQSIPWGLFVALEALLGLGMILPSNLWLLRGLEGVLQFQGQVVPLPTISLLDSRLFILNLLTGPLLCILAGLVVRRQYQLWMIPRREASQHISKQEEM
ncbi:MAG TPA: hypothetical protein VFV38_45485 [Ktedonobacteraceae bacterium]|nr:hypothetical protein [Ktedonobacteraceae bacterium]